MPESITSLIEAKVESAGFKLPVFNQIALDIQKAIQMDADLPLIEALILKDQALASEVLRVANSAFFAGLAKQQTVRQALTRIGINRSASVIMLAAQRHSFNAKHPFLAQIMQKLWQQAVASAGGCRWVALKSGFRDLAETAFLVGLLHNLGSLVVLKALDEICSSAAELEQQSSSTQDAQLHKGAPSQALELTDAVILEVIDSLHTDYGYRVMQSWEFPQEYAEIARDHHDITAHAQNPLLQMVRLVDAACRKVGIGMDSEPDLVLEALPEALMLGIRDVHLAELEIELEEMLEQLA